MAHFDYTVRGCWPFPLDMLRHDGSRAASAADQAMIDRLSAEHAPDRAAFEKVDINLSGPNKPNTARWESFGWSVPGDLEHQWIKREREKGRRASALLQSALGKLSPEEAEAVRTAIAADRQAVS
ncbi:MAG TPA: hypothetical protein VL358_04460 [Caulobacteraceae bacterium]|jgi:hypothetical protein|nr:hypothetical protein [Caulobacteraceae bacterium]